jgi:hypothetical protein
MNATVFFWLIYRAAERIDFYSAGEVIAAGEDFGPFALGGGTANLVSRQVETGRALHAMYTIDGETFETQLTKGWYPKDAQKHEWVSRPPTEIEAMKIRLNV